MYRLLYREDIGNHTGNRGNTAKVACQHKCGKCDGVILISQLVALDFSPEQEAYKTKAHTHRFNNRIGNSGNGGKARKDDYQSHCPEKDWGKGQYKVVGLTCQFAVAYIYKAYRRRKRENIVNSLLYHRAARGQGRQKGFK